MTNEIFTTNEIEMHVDVASLTSNKFHFKLYLSGTPIQKATHDDIVRLLQHAMHKFLCELDSEQIEEVSTPEEL